MEEEKVEEVDEAKQIELLKEKIVIAWHDPNVLNTMNTAYRKQLKDNGYHENKITYFDQVECCVENHKYKKGKTDVIITSGSGGEILFQELHKIPNYVALFQGVVFCNNVQYHSTWAQKYKAIKKVTNDFQEVLAFLDNFTKEKLRGDYVAFSDDFVYPFEINGEKYQDEMINPLIELKAEALENGLESLKEVANEFVDKMIKRSPELAGNRASLLEKQLKSAEDALTENPFYMYSLNSFLNPEINRRLRENKGVDLIAPFLFRLIAEMIRKQENPKYAKKSTTLYRGCRFSSYQIAAFKKVPVNKTMIFPSFSSSCLDKELAEKFGNVLLRIEVPESESINMYPIDLSADSAYPGEGEVVFPMGSEFLVKEVSKTKTEIKLQYRGTAYPIHPFA
jgi:hypothetical protein